MFPLDILKMDRSLLAAGASPVTSGLASAVLGLGETFQLEVVAEGIEYPEQSATLRSSAARPARASSSPGRWSPASCSGSWRPGPATPTGSVLPTASD